MVLESLSLAYGGGLLKFDYIYNTISSMGLAHFVGYFTNIFTRPSGLADASKS